MHTLCLQGGVCVGGGCCIACARSEGLEAVQTVVNQEAQVAEKQGPHLAYGRVAARGFVGTMVLLRGCLRMAGHGLGIGVVWVGCRA